MPIFKGWRFGAMHLPPHPFGPAARHHSPVQISNSTISKASCALSHCIPSPQVFLICQFWVDILWFSCNISLAWHQVYDMSTYLVTIFFFFFHLLFNLVNIYSVLTLFMTVCATYKDKMLNNIDSIENELEVGKSRIWKKSFRDHWNRPSNRYWVGKEMIVKPELN